MVSPSAMSDITQYLNSLEPTDAKPSEEILPLVYNELRRHAAIRMSRESGQQTLQPTALVHEAWLRVINNGGRQWQNRGHFFSAAAEAMRRILIDNARRKSRLKRGGDQTHVDIDQVDPAAASPEERILLINEALERLQERDPDKAQVVVLKFFGGHTNEEVADILGVSGRTVERHWSYAKAWLFHSISNPE